MTADPTVPDAAVQIAAAALAGHHSEWSVRLALAALAAAGRLHDPARVAERSRAATDAEGLCLNCGGLGWFAVGEDDDMIEPECPCVERDRLRVRVAELAAENERLRVDWSRASFAERPLADR